MINVEHFIAQVVNVKDDPEKSGRAQIRIYGRHDDTNRIKDADLPWARCVFSVTNPVHGGSAGATTGLMVNSTVVGFFADVNKQIPLITGTLGSGSANYGSDFPQADRGSDHNDILNKSLPSIGKAEAKSAVEKTIGNIEFAGQDISQMLGQIGAGNIVGAIKSGLGVIQQFDSLKNSISSVGSLDNITGMVNGFVNSVAGGLESEATSAVASLTGGGTVINLTQSLESWKLSSFVENAVSDVSSPLTDTINHLAGSIATRTSKLPITNVSDALSQLNGFRFVMGGVMNNLDSALNTMMSEI